MFQSTGITPLRGRSSAPSARGRSHAALIQPVARALDRAGLVTGSLILTAISGGPDSVAMLHALVELQSRSRFKLAAAHYNHRLRGAESDRDEEFVRQLCDELGIELIVERSPIGGTTGPNLEERTRELRHSFLNRAADRLGASLIALAHQADDQAETVLMRLLRGAGAAGLAAIAESGPGRLWRPLLTVRRAAIMAFLAQIGATWRTDSSNASPLILRNRIRRDLLPLIERDFVPRFAGRLTELAAEMRSLDEFVTCAARTELAQRHDGDRINLAGLDKLPRAVIGAIMREELREELGGLRRISRDHIEMMRALCVGAHPSGRVVLPGGWQFRRDYGYARLERLGSDVRSRAQHATIELGPGGVTQVVAGFCFDGRVIELAPERSIPLPANLLDAIFDADQSGSSFAVRGVRAGDRIAPHGMAGSRKIQDLFVDRKIPRDLRPLWPLIVSGEKVLWIPGVARSRIALVSPATKKILRLRAVPVANTNIASLLKKRAPC